LLCRKNARLLARLEQISRGAKEVARGDNELAH
jgi:hypothetical protein